MPRCKYRYYETLQQVSFGGPQLSQGRAPWLPLRTLVGEGEVEVDRTEWGERRTGEEQWRKRKGNGRGKEKAFPRNLIYGGDIFALAFLAFVSMNVRVPAGCVDAFKYSFFPTTIRIWNQLPADVVMSPFIEVFKSQLMGISATQTSI